MRACRGSSGPAFAEGISIVMRTVGNGAEELIGVAEIQHFVDGIASSVSVVAPSAAGEYVVVACNEHFFDMVGGRRTTTRRFPFVLDALIPSYARRELRTKIEECLETGLAQEIEQAYDFRNSTHWWRLSLKPFQAPGPNGPFLSVLITGIDITPKMELQHQLEVSTSRFRAVVDAAYDAIITIDQQHCITLFNRAAENLFGYDKADMLGQPLELLIPGKFRDQHRSYVHSFARSPVHSRQMDERNRIYGQHRDGRLVPVEIAISKINVDGLVEYTAVIRDITDRVHLMDLLQKEAATDPLTGLPNRREFTNVVEQMLASPQKLSVLMLDIDHFKTINDGHGHEAGDEVLQLLARVCSANVRDHGIFARLGGEEFVAAFPDADGEQARAIAERLRGMFERQDFDQQWGRPEPIPFTVSIGVTARQQGETDIDAILKRADQALYRAKEAGRNRVEMG